MVSVVSSARQASNSQAMAALARFGLSARALVYVIIGFLAVQIALGHSGPAADQRGALAEIAQHPFGSTLLWVLAVGFAAYAIWRLSEAAFGTAAEGRKTGPRLQSLVRGIIYGFLAVSAVAFTIGASTESQAQQQQTWTARLMRNELGRWVVALAGLAIVFVGLGMIVEGATKKFTKQLQLAALPDSARATVIRLGIVGTVARGVVFAVVGGLVLDAAITYDPGKSAGLDGALRTLADRAYGQWLLGLVALGLIAFGIYGFAAARWAKV